jgi:hypothetical protein
MSTGERFWARAIPMALLCALAASACSAHRSLGRNVVDELDAGADAAAAPPDVADAPPDVAPETAEAPPVVPVPTIPKPKEACPALAGLTGANVTVLGSSVKIWSGPAGTSGPMVFYWHATSATADEAVAGLGPGTREVVVAGGVIASFTKSNGLGTNTGDLTWYTGDFATADEILACAHQQGLVDVTHIHSAGYSPGSCQTAAMVYARAYLASVICYSGGAMTMGALPDPKNPPAIIGAHGAEGRDVFGIDIAKNTLLLEDDLKGKGSFVIDCNDGGDHLQSGPARLAGVSGPGWQFLKDHRYKVAPEPYPSLPSTFPPYCKIM